MYNNLSMQDKALLALGILTQRRLDISYEVMRKNNDLILTPFISHKGNGKSYLNPIIVTPNSVIQDSVLACQLGETIDSLVRTSEDKGSLLERNSEGSTIAVVDAERWHELDDISFGGTYD